MISKNEAEENLLKIFYDVKLDQNLKKKPTHVKIVEFEETQDLNDLDHYYNIKDGILQIGIRANSLEQGIPFIAVHMASDSAKKWHEEYLSNHWGSFFIFECTIFLIMMLVILILKYYPGKLIGILIDIIGTGIFTFFFVYHIKWKKRILVRFKGFFKNTGIILPEEILKKYAKKTLNDLEMKTTDFSQYFIAFLLILNWIFALY